MYQEPHIRPKRTLEDLFLSLSERLKSVPLVNELLITTPLCHPLSHPEEQAVSVMWSPCHTLANSVPGSSRLEVCCVLCALEMEWLLP